MITIGIILIAMNVCINRIKIRYTGKYNIYLCQKSGSIPCFNDETISNEIRYDGKIFMLSRMPLIFS